MDFSGNKQAGFDNWHAMGVHKGEADGGNIIKHW
jgi:hypothetical protein